MDEFVIDLESAEDYDPLSMLPDDIYVRDYNHGKLIREHLVDGVKVGQRFVWRNGTYTVDCMVADNEQDRIKVMATEDGYTMTFFCTTTEFYKAVKCLNT